MSSRHYAEHQQYKKKKKDGSFSNIIYRLKQRQINRSQSHAANTLMGAVQHMTGAHVRMTSNPDLL